MSGGGTTILRFVPGCRLMTAPLGLDDLFRADLYLEEDKTKVKCHKTSFVESKVNFLPRSFLRTWSLRKRLSELNQVTDSVIENRGLSSNL